LLTCGLALINYNTSSFLKAALQTAIAQREKFTQLVVIDNASNDDWQNVLLAYPEVECVSLRENIGYAAAANRAFFHLQTDIVLIANSDILLAEDFSKQVRLFFEANSDYAALAPLLLRFDRQTVDSAGQKITLSASPGDRGFGKPLAKLNFQAGEVFSACGAIFIFQKKKMFPLVNQGQLFDEDFFIFWEDFDLGWRMQRAGLKIYFQPEIRVLHFRSATLKTGLLRRFSLSLARPASIKYHLVKNRYLTLIKNFTLRSDWYRIPFIFFKDILWLPLMIAFSPSILVKCWKERRLFIKAWIRRKNG